MSTKKVSVRFNFPATKNIYLSVLEPDDTFGDQVFQTTLVYDKDKGDELVEQIEKLDPRLKGLVSYKEMDDGQVSFKVKQKKFVTWIDKNGERQTQEMSPRVLNLDNTDYEGKEPWGGTIAEVGCLIETQKGARGKGIIAALRLRGIRIHELVTGGAQEGDGDPLFGAPVARPRVEEETADEIPFEFDTDSETV
jgi:hypothetical protein